MSVSTARLAKELKKLLDVATNAEVLETVRALQKVESDTILVAVRYVPGQPPLSAVVIPLAPKDPGLADMIMALQAGQMVLNSQYERLAVEAQAEVARIQAQLGEEG